MRRLLCILALSVGTLMACGTSEVDDHDALGTQQQGLACDADGYCDPPTVCAQNFHGGLCRPACPSSGICGDGQACLTQPDGPPYCPW
ncbi:MAG: hypothetical protein ACXU86_01470 [Archangium sp.]